MTCCDLHTGPRNAYQNRYGTALVLFIFVLGMNIIATAIRVEGQGKEAVVSADDRSTDC